MESWETSRSSGGSPRSDRGRRSSQDWRIGSVVDKYTIVRLLGRGGMGAVYEARHKLSRRFAIKFLHPDIADNPEVLRRFENEAKAAGSLEHANLAAVIDSGRAADGAPYLVMEFLAGEDCSSLLRRLGPLPISRAADIVFQACRGVAVAHKAGIIHRDLKPANLFLADAGDGSDLVKVLDFGIAKLRSTDGSRVTRIGAAFGTPHYMSPEQAQGTDEVDGRTDVWSLGVVLYELLSGRRPFMGDHLFQSIHEILTSDPPRLATLRRGLPAGLVTVVQRAMAKDVERRLPTVAALAEALGPFAGRDSSVRIRRATPRLSTVLATARGVRARPERWRILDVIPVAPSRSVAMLSIGVGLALVAAIAAVVSKGHSANHTERIEANISPVARAPVSPVPSPTASDDDSARTYLELAESLGKEKRFELAQEVLGEASKLRIKSAELNIRMARLSDVIETGGFLKKATSLLEDKDWRGAIDASKAALERDSENAEAIKILTMARMGLQPTLFDRTGKARERAHAGTLTVTTTPPAMVASPASPTEGAAAVTAGPQATPEHATPPRAPSPVTPVAANPASPRPAPSPQLRRSGPVVSVMPRSPIPKPTLPRDHFADNAEQMNRVCQLVESAAVSLGGVSPEFARGITEPLRRSLGDGGEMYGVAMYYFIIREASLQHDSKTAAENLAAAQSKGFLLQLKNLPGNDRDP